MEKNEEEEVCIIKVLACWGKEEDLRLPLALGDDPKQIYALSASDVDGYRRLLKRLELLADLLPYLTKAEEEALTKKEEIEWNLILENLKTALALGII